MKVKALVLTCSIASLTVLAAPIRPTAQEQRQPGERSGRLTEGTQNPVPLSNQPLVPDAVAPGGPDFTLTVNGTGFVSGSVVNWNGSPRTTTFVSSSQLTASILSSDIATASTASITVVNPSPGGGTSNAVFFPITTPTSSLSFSRSDLNSGGYGADSVATADFNGDGKLDLAVANDLGSNVGVLLGNGDGTFQPQVSYTTDAFPDSVVLRDFNGDGKLDIAVRSSSSFAISVLLGNGDGTFQPLVDSPTSACIGRLASGDFNRDGKLDLACASYTANNVAILLGNGDGTFQRELDYPAGSGADAVAAGDFNGDGKLDLAITDTAGATGVSVLLGNGDGTFQVPTEYATGGVPADSLEVGDLNGDGALDLAAPNQNNTVSVLLGNGDGTFKPHVDYPVASAAGRSAIGDINGDGNLDLIVTPRDSSNVLSVLLGNGDGAFGPGTTYPTGASALGVVAGDFNGDGRLDLATADNGASTVSVLLQITGPLAVLSPTSLNFGTQLVGTASAAQTVTLTNTGIATLNISSITASAHFLEANTCGSTVAAGASCTIYVKFKPSLPGTVTGTVTVTDNAPGSPQTVSLTGVGTAVSLSPTSVNFGNQPVGTTSGPQTVTLTNHAATPLSIFGVGTTGTDKGDFAQTNTCGSSVPAGSSCVFSVTFTPTTKGSRTATLNIRDNGGASPQTVALSGTGT